MLKLPTTTQQKSTPLSKIIAVGLAIVGTVLIVCVMTNSDASKHSSGLSNLIGRSSTRNEKEVVSADTNWAPPMTGTYAPTGNPSSCFKIRGNPHSPGNGFVLEPSDAMTSVFGAGFGIMTSSSAGKLHIFDSNNFALLPVPFSYSGSSVTINGKTYQKIGSSCATGFTSKPSSGNEVAGIYNGVGICQLLSRDPNAGGFLNIFSGPAFFVSGGGGYDEYGNFGFMGGYEKTAVYHEYIFERVNASAPESDLVATDIKTGVVFPLRRVGGTCNTGW